MSTESARANRCPRSQIPDLMALPPAEEHQVSGSDRIVGTHTPRSRRRFKALPIAIDAPQRPPHPRRAVRPGSPEMGKSTYLCGIRKRMEPTTTSQMKMRPASWPWTGRAFPGRSTEMKARARRGSGGRHDGDGVDHRLVGRAPDELDGDRAVRVGGRGEVLFNPDVLTVATSVHSGLDDVEVLQHRRAVDVHVEHALPDLREVPVQEVQPHLIYAARRKIRDLIRVLQVTVGVPVRLRNRMRHRIGEGDEAIRTGRVRGRQASRVVLIRDERPTVTRTTRVNRHTLRVRRIREGLGGGTRQVGNNAYEG